MKSKKTRPIPDLLKSIDFPHTRHGGSWLQTGAAPINKLGFSHDRLVYYAEKLRKLGMDDSDIQGMFGDLYWDAYAEFQLNDTYQKLDERNKK